MSVVELPPLTYWTLGALVKTLYSSSLVALFSNNFKGLLVPFISKPPTLVAVFVYGVVAGIAYIVVLAWSNVSVGANKAVSAFSKPALTSTFTSWLVFCEYRLAGMLTPSSCIEQVAVSVPISPKLDYCVST